MRDCLEFECPHCETNLQASYRLLGSTQTCPECGGQALVQVPTPSDADIVLVGLTEEAADTPN